jgi:hypothetical protein
LTLDLSFVMAGLVPAIHVLLYDGRTEKKGVDARHKTGHDVVRPPVQQESQP